MPAAAPGKQIAKVKKIHSDDNKQFRVEVDVISMGQPEETIWARVAAPQGSNGSGFYNMPEEGDEVTISFLNNDYRFPVIDGSVYSKAHKMPVDPDGGGEWDGKQSDNDVKGFFSKSGMMMRWQEKEKIFQCETPAGNIITMTEKDESIIIVDQNKNKITMHPKGIDIYTPKDMKIDVDGKMDVNVMKDITINSKANIKMKAMSNADFEATSKATVKGSLVDVKASGPNTIKGLPVKIN